MGRSFDYWLGNPAACDDESRTYSEKGVQKFGGLRWLRMNELAVEAATMFGIPYTKPVFKVAIMRIIFRVGLVFITPPPETREDREARERGMKPPVDSRVGEIFNRAVPTLAGMDDEQVIRFAKMQDELTALVKAERYA